MTAASNNVPSDIGCRRTGVPRKRVTIAVGLCRRTKKFPDPAALRTNPPAALPASTA
jgi:hypothetical protein